MIHFHLFFPQINKTSNAWNKIMLKQKIILVQKQLEDEVDIISGCKSSEIF